jgi:hypothetical protein
VQRRRPRAVTLTLPNARQPFVVIEGKKYTLRNFSEDGVGLWAPSPAPFGLAPGSNISGDVVLDQEIFPVKLEVRHRSPGVIGLEIMEAPPELHQLFKRLLEPSYYASTLVVHAASQTEDPDFGQPRLWYHGEGGSELLVWYESSQKTILAMQLAWLGKWVFRGQYQNTRTGFLPDRPADHPGQQLSHESLWVVHEQPDSELLYQAAQFLTSVPSPLPGGLLWQFLETGEQMKLSLPLFDRLQIA